MIKFDRLATPEKLTKEKVAELTDIFKKDNKKTVWNQSYIKENLMVMSNKKCAYCESPLDNNGVYMEVEHFKPKSIYPDEVVSWDNLLPSCKTCNGKKKDHDPEIAPIINPCKMNPQDHLKLTAYRLRGKDDIGQLTIELLNLNDIERLMTNRFLIFEALREKIISLQEDCKNFDDGGSVNFSFQMNRIRNRLVGVLQSAQPDKSYSAILSTHLLFEESYYEVKKFLFDNNMWDSELTELEANVERIRLSI